MTIQTNLTSRDLFSFLTYLFLRSKYLWFAILAGTTWRYYLVLQEGSIEGIANVVANFIIHFIYDGILISFALIAWLAVYTWYVNHNPKGVLGNHEFSLTNEGIIEKTDTNETLIKWSGIRNLMQTKKFIVVQASVSDYHLLPKRDFTNEEQLELFWEALFTQWNDNKK